MSKPRINYENKLQGAMSQLRQAQSALNMYPEPIKGAMGYLSEVDSWAAHSMEHMEAALTLLIEYQKDAELSHLQQASEESSES